jgi:hypothetical protein
MEALQKVVRRVHRRLVLQSLAVKLAWCWFATLVAAAVAIAVGKWWPLVDDQTWALGCLGTALGVGTLAAFVWTWIGRQDAHEAAVEIDRRFGLKERVSSTLALEAEQLETPIGQALVRDAQRRVDQLDVLDKFRLPIDRRALLPVLPAAVACALAIFVTARAPENPAQAATAESAQIKQSARTLVKKLDATRKEAAEKGLKEVDGLLKQLEDGMKNVAEKSQTDRKQALVALNDLAKDAEKKRQQLTGAADMKQQLNQLKNLQQGPATKLGQALKNADLAKAIQELDKLKQQLSDDKLDPQAKEAMAKQLEQLQQSLEKKIQAQQQAQDELKEQIATQRRAGNTAAADKLLQQLDKLAQKAPQMDKLGQMAQQLKQAAEATKQGNAKQASEALSKLSDQLSGMQQELAEMETLDSALAEMSDCKNAMSCKECDGEGCKACQGNGEKFSDQWMRSDFGRGGGVGAGARPETKNDTEMYDSQVKPNVGKGASVVAGQADGPNRKGKVQDEIKGQFTTSSQETAEALSGQRLPHDYRDHAKKYFDALREGQR